MDRYPYQVAQTSMERHVIELVAHFRNGSDTLAGFAQAVERAQSHAFWLENIVKEQQAEIEKLYTSRIPGMPSVSASSELSDFRQCARVAGPLAFDWRMENIAYRALWHGYDVKDHDLAKRVKRRAFRALLRLFRAEFEKTWTLNLDKLHG